MLPLSEKVKVLNKERKKKLCAEVAKFYSKNKFSIREIVKKKKKFMLLLLSHLKLQKLQAQWVIST